MDTPPLNTLDSILKYLLDFIVLPVLAYFAKLLKDSYEKIIKVEERIETNKERLERVEEKVEKIEDRLLNHIERKDD